MHALLTPRLAAWLGLAAAVVAQEAVYLRGVDNAFVSDDWWFVYGASLVRSWDDAVALITSTTPEAAEAGDFFARPVQWLFSLALWWAFGGAPAGYHMVSQALDLANAALLSALAYQVLRWARPALPGRDAALPAATVGVVFVLNWRHHEVVLWSAAANELLATLGRLAALNLFVLWWRGAGPSRPVAAGVIAATGFAVLSKESAVTLPAVSLLFAAVLRACRPPAAALGRGLRSVLALAGVQAALVGAWLLVAWLRSQDMAVYGVDPERSAVSPLEWLWAVPRFFAGHSLAGYAVERAAPVLAERAFLAAVALGGAALAALALRQHQWLWLGAVGWTVVVTLPYVAFTGLSATGEVGIGGDRFLYASSCGWAATVVATVAWAGEAVRPALVNAAARRCLAAGAVGLGIVPAAGHLVQTYRQEGFWDEAGAISRGVVQALLSQLPAVPQNAVLCLWDLPDNHRGKYVMRNGVTSQLYLAYGADDFLVRVRGDERGCTIAFRYDPGTAALRPAA